MPHTGVARLVDLARLPGMTVSQAADLPPAPPQPMFGGLPVGDPILDAAARCIHRKSFDNTSLEEVAVEAGISRATIYRRFGSRDQLFTALLWARSKPFREWAKQILVGEGTVAERVETVFTTAVLEAQRVGWLDSSIRTGVSPLGRRLMTKAFAQDEEGLGVIVSTSLAERTDFGDITANEILEWMGRQMVDLASAEDWDEVRLRARVRYFIVPVVVRAAAQDGIGNRLAAIEARLDQVLAATSGVVA